MGIYDRHYIRGDASPGAGHGRAGVGIMRMWSFNTWLIIACVAVFMIDGFLPTRWVVMRVVVEDAAFVDLDASAIIEGPRPDRAPRGTVAAQPLLWQSPRGIVRVGRREMVSMRFIESFMHFSTARGLVYLSPTYGLVGFEFWRFIGFQFLHASPSHLLFNMLGLFFFGPLVERYLGSKRYVAFYLLCGIFGALMYMALNLGGVVAGMLFGPSVTIPGLLFNSPATPLVGASAGVFGVLMAGAFLAPRATVLLFFFLPMQLRTLAYVLLFVALLNVIFGGANAGGDAGHVGGALAGYYFIRHPRHLHGFFDILGRVDPTSHHYRHRPGARDGPRRPNRDAVDRILEKVHRDGVHSLSAREKRILEEASRTDR